MRFFETVFAGAALVAAAFALEINDFPQNPEAGKTYTITYSPKDNTPTQIILRKGESTNLDTVATLGTATGGSFQWTVDSALPSGTNYAIQVKQGDTVNYSKQFPISGGSPSASASASASSVSASVSSALSSAISSALSSASSAASVATLTTSASASVSSSAGTNTTISSATLSASKSGAATTGKPTGSSTSSGGGAPANTGAASVLGSSPLALIFGAVAAMAYVN